LLGYWSKLLEELEKERDLAITLKQVIEGNLDPKNIKKDKVNIIQ